MLNEWSKNFSKRKEKSSLPSLGCFWLNKKEKLENEVYMILLRSFWLNEEEKLENGV